jgi:hypothetical protein
VVEHSGRTALVSQQAGRSHSWGTGGPARWSTPPGWVSSAHRHKESLCIGVDKRGDVGGSGLIVGRAAEDSRSAPLSESIDSDQTAIEYSRPGIFVALGHMPPAGI